MGLITVFVCPLIAASKGYKWGVFVPLGFFFPLITFLVTLLLETKVKGRINVPSSAVDIIHEPIDARKNSNRCIYCGERLEKKICNYCEQKNRYFKQTNVQITPKAAKPEVKSA